MQQLAAAITMNRAAARRPRRRRRRRARATPQPARARRRARPTATRRRALRTARDSSAARATPLEQRRADRGARPQRHGAPGAARRGAQPARHGDAGAGERDPRRDERPRRRRRTQAMPRQRAIERQRERHRLDHEQPDDDGVTRQLQPARLRPPVAASRTGKLSSHDRVARSAVRGLGAHASDAAVRPRRERSAAGHGARVAGDARLGRPAAPTTRRPRGGARRAPSRDTSACRPTTS